MTEVKMGNPGNSGIFFEILKNLEGLLRISFSHIKDVFLTHIIDDLICPHKIQRTHKISNIQYSKLVKYNL